MAELGFKQQFVLVENIAALAEIHLANDYPSLMHGILIESEKTLKQGFNVEKFISGREANPKHSRLSTPKIKPGSYTI